MHKYMFDTNIYNALKDGEADLTPYFGKAKFYATHLQLDELNKTSDETRRERLSQLFEEITSDSIPTESFAIGISRIGRAKLAGDNVIPTESAVYDVSKFGQAKYTSNDNLVEPIRREMNKVKKKLNNTQDAQIAETAIKNGLTLVTHDALLFKFVTKYGGACENIHQVIKELSIMPN